jgi:hypothetical protein
MERIKRIAGFFCMVLKLQTENLHSQHGEKNAGSETMKKIFFLIILFAGLIALAAPVEASLTYNYDTKYSHGFAPASDTTPWLSATFSDTDTTDNTLLLTLSADNLTGSEFVSNWYFNLDPAFKNMIPWKSRPGSVKIEYLGGTEYPTVGINSNSYKAGSNGDFDIRISFATKGSKRFEAGDSATFKITFDPGTSDLSLGEDSFNFASEGKHGGLYTAAHVQGIHDKFSSWVTGNPKISMVTAQVPIPGAIWLLGSGLLGLLGIRRRRKK